MPDAERGHRDVHATPGTPRRHVAFGQQHPHEQEQSMAKIAFLGMGAMGSRMARTLLDAGHDLIVWNRTPERCAPLVEAGATQADTPRDAAAQAEFTISMLRDTEVSREVWCDPETGAFAGLPEEAIAIESSTITPEGAAELGSYAITQQRRFVEAPVSGTLPQAENGVLVYFLGGEAETAGRVHDVLDPLAKAQHHVGTWGMGARMKLATNAMLGVQVAAWAEIIPMLERGGMDVDLALEALSSTPIWTPNAPYITGTMQRSDFTPQFPVDLISKDFRYAIAEGGDARMPMTEAAKRLFARASEAGHGAENMTGVVQVNRD
tara:strand:+ start:1074 stop:2039 length:966 start_codon:yes stop_codon:yes gene_type:complete